MDRAVREAAERAFRTVLGGFAFMLAEGVSGEELPVAAREYLETRVSFTGPLRGTVRFVLPQGTAREVAANMLGMNADAEVSEEQIADACAELVSVGCGHMVAGVAGEDAATEVTAAEVMEIAPADVEEVMRRDPIRLMLDDQAAALVVEVTAG